ncbi:50S ribosomal protein L18 [Clostridium tetani]|uniref:Large ribosomal subunit protein uL18 n=2 Tax=Clostridium tetani TaxID=1513 RepID=RL18_CLOTE|nr:50S ribosomal protein L18 [Clostridium tetani]Q890Q1.1 RecName: Full=Large ribosomal subunit protein uL18; AltName: Full=50S ribosomal protein L18 [Clostridium tetani E88]AAO37044.1 LSU ribosomal protein L18P [Clostridium tetani E88]AVP54715.1 50S ribosomal protein L18 [Clostridium tetani]KGI36684.1 50S ribosomal protein L18 [Clostridium tetani ATCC 9441]KGI38741.1 50S ribosomal protein L18 [Clostridium tetani]KGI43203.1 50S ribosomal protein L18 [Clostridium tetani]
MFKKQSRQKGREKRHLRIRKNIFGTPEMPRLSVYRSEKNIYAQIIDDLNGVTLVAASSLDKEFDAKGSNKDGAKLVGELVAKRAIEKGVTKVVFDRGGYIYHGRVQELAEGAREAGLQF